MKLGLLLTFVVVLNFLGCNGYLDISLSSATSSLRGTPISVNVHVNNINRESIYLLKWGTPFETDGGFQVLLNNITIPYEGVSIYRISTPAESDYIEIRAGEIKNLKSELWKNFDFTKIGTYHIRLEYFIQGYTLTSAGDKVIFGPFYGLSNEIVIDIIENPNIPASNKPFHPSTFHTRASYPCSSTQLNTINSAWSTAKSAISSANTNFNGGSTNYAKWFGARSITREARVKTVLGKLNSLSKLTYNCGGPSCTSSTYGYVYPTDTAAKNVYLCGAFWPVVVEQVRTLVHEATHFNDIGGTQDYAYGMTPCQNLAKSTPDKAVYNADNNCYYVY